MATTNNNKALLHRKEWQMMTPAPTATAVGSSVIAPDSGNRNNALYMQSATVHYIYNHDEDSWLQIPSGALAGTFGAGFCGAYLAWSNTYTTNGGSTTSVTVAAASFNISGRAVGQPLEILSGTNIGKVVTVSSIATNAGNGTITINFTPALASAVVSGVTFRTLTGRFFVMNGGTVAAGSFKVLDVATMSWTTLAITGLPASWGTDADMVIPFNYGERYSVGTATAGAATTITNSAKAWGTNQWTNYQVKITGGTGIGQVRKIASNTGTVITVATAWTTNPDATSTYEITANEDDLYLIGNGAVTMYKYSISGNTWSTVTPGTARAAAPSTGLTFNFFGVTGNTLWADETNIQDGRFIYSLRAGGSSVMDRYDIATNAWQVVNTVATETFTTGSAAFNSGEFYYVRKDSTNRFFKYSVVDNAWRPFSINLYQESTAALGCKIWVKNYDPTQAVQWVYSLRNSGSELHRIMVI